MSADRVLIVGRRGAAPTELVVAWVSAAPRVADSIAALLAGAGYESVYLARPTFDGAVEAFARLRRAAGWEFAATADTGDARLRASGLTVAVSTDQVVAWVDRLDAAGESGPTWAAYTAQGDEI